MNSKMAAKPTWLGTTNLSGYVTIAENSYVLNAIQETISDAMQT